MSGEGVITGGQPIGARLVEDSGRSAVTREGAVADVLAYLRRRQSNCTVMARANAEFAPAARERARQLGVLIDEIAAGFHEGAAAVEAQLAAELQADAALLADDVFNHEGEQE